MRSGTQPVKMQVEDPATGKKVTKEVGQATYPIFDLVDEAVDQLGAEKTLELINAQVRTNEMNRIRGLARGGPSKTLLKNKAIARITQEEWMEVAGDLAAIERLIERKMAEVRSELESENPLVHAGASDDENEG